MGSGPDRSKSVISCLLPRGDIADDYIIRIIGSLSNKDKDIKVTVSNQQLTQHRMHTHNIHLETTIEMVSYSIRYYRDKRKTQKTIQCLISLFDLCFLEVKVFLYIVCNMILIVFHLLNRPYTCHLLYFLTHRQHVTPYRIRILYVKEQDDYHTYLTYIFLYRNELIESEKDNKELIGLLMVYQTYNLDIAVSVNVRLVNAFVFEVKLTI
jgi:hypothetical protein